MRDLVEKYIIPQTQGSGVGYALKMNACSPREVNVMVSHAWDENVGEFFDALCRSVNEEDVMFICALSLYQCEDGKGPTINQQLGTDATESPFRRVLDHITKKSEASWRQQCLHECLRVGWTSCFLVALFVFYYPIGAKQCIPTLDGCALGKKVSSRSYGHTLLKYPNCWFPQWTFEYQKMDEKYSGFLPAAIVMLAIAVLLRLVDLMLCRYRGFMIAVPNRECDLYSRLWCVYEIFVACKLGVNLKIAKTLASAGQCKWADAHCSNGCDRDRIHLEILSWAPDGGIWSRKDAAERVDAAIRKVTRFGYYSMWLTLFSYVFPYVLMQIAMSVDHIKRFGSVPMPSDHVCDGFFSIALGGALVMGVTFQVTRLKQGVLNRTTCLFTSVVLLAIGIALQLVGTFLTSISGPSSPEHWPMPFHHCFVTTIMWGGLTLAILTELRCLLFLSTRVRIFLVLAILLLSVALYVWWGSVGGLRADQVYPLAVWFISFRAVPMLGVPSCFLLSAETWGIRFEGEPIWGECGSFFNNCGRQERGKSPTTKREFGALPV